MNQPTPPAFNIGDYVVLTPEKADTLHGLEPGMFHLVRVLCDHPHSFEYEPLIGGPCALVEAIAISAAFTNRGEKVWLPFTTPFGKNNHV